MIKNKSKKVLCYIVTACIAIPFIGIHTNIINSTAYAQTIDPAYDYSRVPFECNVAESKPTVKFGNVEKEAIVSLNGHLKFRPEDCITKEQLAEILQNEFPKANLVVKPANSTAAEERENTLYVTVPCSYTVESYDNSGNVMITLTTQPNETISESLVFGPVIFKLTPMIDDAEDDTDTTNSEESVILKSVSIKGKRKVGEELSVVAKDKNGHEITSGLSYRWYRVRNKNDVMGAYGTMGEYGRQVGINSTYKVKEDDKNEYIGVLVSYKGESAAASCYNWENCKGIISI